MPGVKKEVRKRGERGRPSKPPKSFQACHFFIFCLTSFYHLCDGDDDQVADDGGPLSGKEARMFGARTSHTPS
jgi:hypothetical protein